MADRSQENPQRERGRHYTCTSNPKYGTGTGTGNEYADISDKNLVDFLGYSPSDKAVSIIMKEQLLRQDRGKKAKNN